MSWTKKVGLSSACLVVVLPAAGLGLSADLQARR